ncbi:hypothetical protein NDA11_002296 [Ustilago hordei]|nr:hypothetical protein NDA10_002117 [Ustilago hordei]KAJ1586173.1 hypothetical protein NDA12_005532 [Ustilago hordei]KAJ1589061.1 hypothetical protein NDA15_001983 [Ustilago hordei]KAJ1590743.1 hypothetical protein NDA11_002296 [Ustilago hordei]KAJ1600640.1 hypothetical protein NDA14_002251 [Ustilago hordei]
MSVRIILNRLICAGGRGANADPSTNSSDGYRFLVDQVTVKASPTIKTMLSMGEGGGFAEAESNTARLQIRGEVLEKVIEYLHFKTKYGAAADLDIPDFKNRIPPEIALELLMAADFLEL